MNILNLDLGERSYPIITGQKLLDNPKIWQDLISNKNLNKGASALIVSNTTVAPLYAKALFNSLKPIYKNIQILQLPDGEEYKNWQSLNMIFDELLKNSFDRKTVLFALGGGVIGDMTGFAAACYMRGIDYIQVPTTLLAQVDSSVGGKTAINHPAGKNMIGAFYQPRAVICDMNTFKTLPKREFSAGLAEVIKYAPIYDFDFINWLENNIKEIMQLDFDMLTEVVQRCCKIKASVVSQDERESGLRAILNFGHTFGHAIEAGMGYGNWLHGEAVAAGMVMALRTSEKLNLVSHEFSEKIIELIKKAGLPITPPIIDKENNAAKYMQLMRNDKKAEAGEIKFVLINEKEGKAIIQSVPDNIIIDVINNCCA